jgi:hypothetical protein
MSELESDSEISSEEECMCDCDGHLQNLAWNFIGILAANIQKDNAKEMIDRIEDMLLIKHDRSVKVDVLGVTRKEIIENPDVLKSEKYTGPYGGTITLEQLDYLGLSSEDVKLSEEFLVN